MKTFTLKKQQVIASIVHVAYENSDYDFAFREKISQEGTLVFERSQ